MRIALLSPKGPLYRHPHGIFRKSLRYAPLTLTTLAALVPPELKADIILIDEGVEEIPAALDVDLIGMTVITGSAPRAYELADRFRRQGRTLVLGGPHVTLLPDEAQSHADAIVLGYAEQTWPQLLRDFQAGRMQPRYLQPPGHGLEHVPIAHRHRLNRKHYLTQDVFEATRSCIHSCDFCVAPVAWGRKSYQKPVERVVDEIRFTKARKAIFIDLNLISDREYARELFTALIPLKLRWYGLSTALVAHDHALMELMTRSGCKGLLIGFESISQGNLHQSNKGFNRPRDYGRVVDALHRHGIAIMGCFVFGMDHDTPEIFAETTACIIDWAIDLPRFALVTPFPGTPLYQRLETEGRILTRDWNLYDGQHVVFQPVGMDVETLRQGHDWAWREVYRFGSITRRLAKSRQQLPLAIAANLGYRHYAYHLARACHRMQPESPACG